MPRAPRETPKPERRPGRAPAASEVPVARRLARAAGAFTGAVAAMADPMRARALAEARLARATRCSASAVSAFLDSAYGGAFGVDVAQRVASGETLEAAVAAVVAEWQARAPSPAETRALALPPGRPALAALVAAAGALQRRQQAAGGSG